MSKVTGDSLKQGKTKGLPPAGWKDAVKLRVLSAKRHVSSNSGNPSLKLETEVFAPEVVKGVGGREYDLRGQKVTYYLALQGDGLEKTLNEVFPKLGLDSEIDPDEPDLDQFKGLCFLATVSCRESTSQKTNPETGEYEDIVDPDTGEPIKGQCQLNSAAWDIVKRVAAPDNVPTDW